MSDPWQGLEQDLEFAKMKLEDSLKLPLDNPARKEIALLWANEIITLHGDWDTPAEYLTRLGYEEFNPWAFVEEEEYTATVKYCDGHTGMPVAAEFPKKKIRKKPPVWAGIPVTASRKTQLRMVQHRR